MFSYSFFRQVFSHLCTFMTVSACGYIFKCGRHIRVLVIRKSHKIEIFVDCRFVVTWGDNYPQLRQGFILFLEARFLPSKIKLFLLFFSIWWEERHRTHLFWFHDFRTDFFFFFCGWEVFKNREFELSSLITKKKVEKK